MRRRVGPAASPRHRSWLTPGRAAATVEFTKGAIRLLGGRHLSSYRRFGWVVVASTVLVPIPASAAEDGGVVGWVESTRGVPLAGAVISIFGKSIHGNRVTLTDAEGQFTLAALPPGSY